jgi:membrane fusion protein (multidrug efflux system)
LPEGWAYAGGEGAICVGRAGAGLAQALDPIWVDFPVPEGTISKFTIGSATELTAEAYPGQLFKGEVEAFDAKLGQDTRTLMVRARVPNPDRKLLPGMFANVAVLAGSAKEFVTVPRTAVTYGLYGDSVWVVKEGPPACRKSPRPRPSRLPPQ